MKCNVANCSAATSRRGMCGSHYRRFLRHGDPLGGGASKAPVDRSQPCVTAGCDSLRERGEYCSRHYRRVKRHGDPAAGRRPNMDSLDEVFDHYMPGDPPPAGVVWPWAGPKHADGYGVLQCQHKFWLAHRYSYQRFVGPIPPGAVVRHRNDTPIDVNPNNLELGSQADNVADMHERGRARKARPAGELNAGHKLTDAEVRKIRDLRNNHGWKLRELSERFGVGESVVSAIARRKTWRHLN